MKRFLPLLLWTGILLTPGVSADAQSLEELIRQGVRANEAGDRETAREIFARAARLNPGSPIPLYHRALSYVEQGRAVEAILDLRAALERDEKHGRSWILLGRLYHESGQPTRAEQELLAGLAVLPGDPEGVRLLAGIYLSRELPGKAAEWLQGALQRNRGDPSLHFLLGQAREMDGDPERAAAEYESAVRADAEFSPAWLSLGKLMALKPEHGARALECLSKFVDLEPDHAEGHLALASLQMALGKAAAAEKHLHEALRLDPRREEAHFRLANLLEGQGKKEEAASARQRFQEIRRQEEELRQKDLSFSAAFREGQKLTQESRLNEAIERFHAALALRPTSDVVHAMLAKVHYSRRNPGEAGRHIQKALESSPANGEYRYVHGLVLIALGSLEMAEQELKLAGSLSPVIGDIFNQLGNLASRRGDLEGAVREFERAIAAEPGEAAFHLNLALALEKQGKMESAAPHRKRYRELTSPPQ